MVNTHNLDSYVDQIIVLNLASDVCEYLDPNLKLPHGIEKIELRLSLIGVLLVIDWGTTG